MTNVTRIGLLSEDGATYTMGKKIFDFAALATELTARGIDPSKRCAPWLVCHGEGAGRAKAECPNFALHSREGSEWHEPVPKLKPSVFDVSRTPEERAASKEAGRVGRLNAKTGARKPAVKK